MLELHLSFEMVFEDCVRSWKNEIAVDLITSIE